MQPVLCVKKEHRLSPVFLTQHGFSLVELSVVLTVVAMLLALAYSVIPKSVDIDMRQQSKDALHDADEAVFGFAAQNFRLPCPDVNGDGAEQCAAGNYTGSLPWKTVGLASKPLGTTGTALKYGVYRGVAADLATASNLFTQMLPATNASGTVITPTAHINGFDFCRNVRDAEVEAYSGARIHVPNSINVAYALADVGAEDANADGSFWDGLNSATGVAFDSPDNMVSQTYDDLIVASSFHRILGRMGCEEMGRAHAVGISAIAAVDIYELWDLMHAVRTNDVGGAELGLLFAQLGEAKAAFELAMALYGLASASACTATSFGVCSFNIPLAAVQLAAATAGVVQATIGLVAAQASLDSANAALIVTTAGRAAALTFADQSVAYALSVDAGGLRR